jgi:RHS repeat-associated protein
VIQNIVVYRTWRGVVDSGQCLGSCGAGTITYPGASYEAYLTLIPALQSAPTGWHGTLFDEGQDDGGLMYRRNRYYDPATGQFTQEDPLGLAGGMNAYGFASSDPVNFSDPFGLSCHVRGNCTQSDVAGPAMTFWDKVKAWYHSPAGQESMLAGYMAMYDDAADGGDDEGEEVEQVLIVEQETAAINLAAKTESKEFSPEKRALVDMAKGDKQRGMSSEDMQAYKELNQTLPDPFPTRKVRGPEAHPNRGPSSQQPHGHVGPVNHIPIRDPNL